jgi:hypothetical protein
VRRVRRSVYCTASFPVCSLRRTELPIIYADFRLDYKLATLPGLERNWTGIHSSTRVTHCFQTSAGCGAILSRSSPGYLGALPSKQTKAKGNHVTLPGSRLSSSPFNQSKNTFIKAADLARYEYQFLVLARKLSLPNMRRQRVLAASLTQFVQGLAKRLGVALKEIFFTLEIY